ncbi:MAG: cytochrome c-type biogenesis protein [Solirubrobacteraceae bacterium]
MSTMRLIRVGLVVATLALPAGAVAAVAGHASLPAIERQAMCVTCKIPLNEAESPQAGRERAFIRELIAQGEDESQIKQALVGQYGPTVLALPSTRGFDATVYVVPAAVVIALLALLAVLLPSWRRRGRDRERAEDPGQPLSVEDAARLNADLERFN